MVSYRRVKEIKGESVINGRTEEGKEKCRWHVFRLGENDKRSLNISRRNRIPNTILTKLYSLCCIPIVYSLINRIKSYEY